MSVILSTDRLYLREFFLSDRSFIITLLNSPGWLRFIGDRHVRTEEEAEKYLLNGPLKSYKENGFGLSMVVKKEDNIPIGMCGLLKRDALEHPDIGFAFLPDFCGHGYANEIVNAYLGFIKELLNIQKVLAITLPTNVNSIRLLEKLNFVLERKTQLTPDSEELLVFERTNL